MVTNNNKFKYDKHQVIRLAKQLVNINALVLDTETTGLGERDEIVEISIIDMRGNVFIDTLIKPTILIPPSALVIHKITNKDISCAPYITKIITELTHLFQNNTVAIYNAEFDLRMLHQSLRAHGQRLPHNLRDNVCCAMELYSIFNGEYDTSKMGYKWIGLGSAATRLGIIVPGNLHRAKIDAELTRQVILRIADS